MVHVSRCSKEQTNYVFETCSIHSSNPTRSHQDTLVIRIEEVQSDWRLAPHQETSE